MNLEQVSEMAKRVAVEHEALEEAKDGKADAEDEVLALVVEAIKPALPAMSTRIEGGAGPAKRGVMVDRMTRIYLGEEGDWFRMMSNKPYRIHPAEVLAAVDLGSIASTLVHAMHTQLGSREDVTSRIAAETRELLDVVSRFKSPARAKR